MSSEPEPNGSGAKGSGAVFETDDESGSPSVVRPLGYSSMECGYCKGERAAIMKPPRTAQDCSKSYAMLADFMTPEAYEDFLYRGWRRSGIHLYKPSNFESCCPTLTIRLLAPSFQPTKSQSKVRRRMENLLSPRVPTPSSCSDATASFLKRCSTKREKEWKTSIAQLEQTIRESGVLNQLQEATRRALSTNFKISNALTTVTWETFLESTDTISYRLQPPSKHNEKHGKVVISSSICARLAGKFKIDRDTLLLAVVQALSDTLVITNRNPSRKEGNGFMPTDSQEDTTNGHANHLPLSIIITSIQSHIKSGQILVEVQLPKSSSASPSSLRRAAVQNSDSSSSKMQVDREDVSMRDDDDDVLTVVAASAGSADSTNATSDTTPATHFSDKLGNWYQITAGKPLTIDKRQLRVQTLPAHQSALDPRVHRLYALYQNIVHQDPDPFQMTADECQPSDCDCPANSVQHNMVTSPSKKTTDVAMTENDDSKFGNAGLDEPTDPIASIADLDWGPNSPKYFSKEILSMLKDYLAPHSLPVQRALLNNYYTFYQFLVESPFEPPSIQPQISLELQSISSSFKADEIRGNRIDTKNGISQEELISKQDLPCGTYHQHYLIGDELIAVGVVDILPKGLSSVYLYYHPGFSHSLVALGKLAILKEVDFTNSLGRPYYYLGYYIESCRKMRYKADYHPSELLCPVTYQWVNCSKALPKIRAVPQNVARLAEEETTTDSASTETDATSKADEVLSHIPMDIGAGMILTLDMLQENGQQFVRPILQDLAEEAGPKLSRQCLVKFS